MYRSNTVIETIALLTPIPLIVAWTFLNFSFANRFDDFSVVSLLGYYLAFTLALVIPATMALLVSGSRRRVVAVVIYMLVVAVFLLPDLQNRMKDVLQLRYLATGSIAMAVVSGVMIARLMPSARLGRTFVILFAILSAIPGGQLVIYHASARTAPGMEFVIPDGKAVIRPNVYFILLDAYARADQLQKVMGYDNTDFQSALAAREFFIAPRAYASYPMTTYSIGTTFRMSHVDRWEPTIRKTVFRGPVMRSFARLGYRIVHVPQMRGLAPCPDGLSCLLNETAPGEFSLGYLGISVIGLAPALPLVLKAVAPHWFDLGNNEISDLHNALKNTVFQEPTFVFAHIDMPHPPYLRDAECRRVESKFGTERGHSGWGARADYVDYLRCGNSQLLPMLDMVINRDPGAIILLQSDHGSYFLQHEEAGSKKLSFRRDGVWLRAALEESYSTVSAWRLPAPCRKWLYDSVPPVNTFRIIFACLSGRKPELLADISYIVDEDKQELRLIRADGKWLIGGDGE